MMTVTDAITGSSASALHDGAVALTESPTRECVSHNPSARRHGLAIRFQCEIRGGHKKIAWRYFTA
jgi:hypothetical protein